MSRPHIPLNGKYPIIVIEYLGQTMRDLNLTDWDVICWNPSITIDCKKIDINPIIFNGKMALCNLTVMSPDNAGNMAYNTLRSLSLLNLFLRMDKPLFICSRHVAGILGLDEDGDAVYIRESVETPYEDNTDIHCDSCKWHVINSNGVSLLHECAMTKTQILRPDTMTCPNWEEL